jgi:uncharacterized protein YjcR
MIAPPDYMRHHGTADVALLFRLWNEGLSRIEIARQFGISVSTLHAWQKRYGLPKRTADIRPQSCEPEPPSEADDILSRESLALSPWVAERAEEVKQMHYAQRRRETDSASVKKARSWRIGENTPRGAGHAV